MKIYWNANSVDELKGLPKAVQRKLFRLTLSEGRKRFGMAKFVMMVVIFVLPFLAQYFIGLMDAAQHKPVTSTSLVQMLCYGLFGAAWGALFYSLVQHPIINKGREWLREQGYPKV